MKHSCSKCGETDLSQFWKRARSKTGLNNWCKKCHRESARESNKTLSQKIRGAIRNSVAIENKILAMDNKKICCKCKEVFEFKKNEIRCKKCESQRCKEYREKNREKVLSKQKEWREKNRELINKKKKRDI